MAELPGMAHHNDPRGYECTALGCRSHGKPFLGSNFMQNARRHSQTPGHKMAHAGEPPDVLEGIRTDKDEETGALTYTCLVCPAKTVFSGASARGNVNAHVKGPTHKAAVQGKTHVPDRPEHLTCGLCGVVGHSATTCTLKPMAERGTRRAHKCSLCKAEGHHASSCPQRKVSLDVFRTCADIVELTRRARTKDFVTPLSVGIQCHDFLPLERDTRCSIPLYEDKSRAGEMDRYVQLRVIHLKQLAIQNQRAMRSARRRVPVFGPESNRPQEDSVYTKTSRLADNLIETLGTFDARQAYRDEKTAALFAAVQLLTDQDQAKLWALPTHGSRETRATLPSEISCIKYNLHLLRDKETYSIVQKDVRPVAIKVNGGLRGGCIKTMRTMGDKLVAMCAHDEAGKQAEKELVASDEAFLRSIQAKQLELKCHHTVDRFQHLMLPAKEGSKAARPATKIMVAESDDAPVVVVADSDGESDDGDGCQPQVPCDAYMYHECKLCGLRKPCAGKDCMLCVQAACFRDMRKRAAPAPVLAPVQSLVPAPVAKRQRLLF
jgi:hypothetical protein